MNRGKAIVVRRKIDEVCAAMRNLYDVNYTPYMEYDIRDDDNFEDAIRRDLVVSPCNDERKLMDAIKVCNQFRKDVIAPGLLDEVEEYIYNGTDTDTAARFADIDTGEVWDWITMSRAKYGNDLEWDVIDDALRHLHKFAADLREYAPTAPRMDLVAVADNDTSEESDTSNAAALSTESATTDTPPEYDEEYLQAFKTSEGQGIIERATAAGFVEPSGDVWKWRKGLRDWAYFAVEVTLLLNLRPSNGNVEWKRIGAIFGMMDKAEAARNNAAKMRDKDPSGDVYADKWGCKPRNSEKIDWILEGD